LIEDGIADIDDLLKERITTLKADRERSSEALSRARGNVKAKAEVTEGAVARFSELMRQRIQNGETPMRKAWLSSIVDRIEVKVGKIRMFGRKDVLKQCVLSGATGNQGVRTFVPRWRTIQDKSANTYVVEITMEF
jgi:site-specific DNA recombinase